MQFDRAIYYLIGMHVETLHRNMNCIQILFHVLEIFGDTFLFNA